MILRKPYAAFIKMFKPIHLVLTFMSAYLIYLSTRVLSFLTHYIYTEESVVGTDIVGQYINSYIYIIPLIFIVVSLLIFGVMFNKKKPTVFYLYLMFSSLIILVLNIYVGNFLEVLEKEIISVSAVKLIHDLVFMGIVIEGTSLVILFSRGLGLDIKKFDFSNDVLSIDISEEDREEIEVNINVDIDEQLRIRKRRLRNFKYFYLEHRYIFRTILLSIILLIIGIFLYIRFNPGNAKAEGTLNFIDYGNLGVERSYLLTHDYKGNKIGENYFVVVDIFVNSMMEEQKFYLNDFRLEVGDTLFKPINKYEKYFRDLGSAYKENILTSNIENHILIFEVPEKYINTNMLLTYSGMNDKLSIRLNLNKERISSTTSYKLGDEITFDKLSGIKFKINNYEINNTHIINYDFCIQDKCMKSKEYLRPNLSENFNESILKLNVDYTNDGTSVKNFYNFFSKYGSIAYFIDDNWNYQYEGFSEVNSTKVNIKNDIFIEIDDNIKNASKIKLVFNVKGTKYEYMLKDDNNEK